MVQIKSKFKTQLKNKQIDLLLITFLILFKRIKFHSKRRYITERNNKTQFISVINTFEYFFKIISM